VGQFRLTKTPVEDDCCYAQLACLKGLKVAPRAGAWIETALTFKTYLPTTHGRCGNRVWWLGLSEDSKQHPICSSIGVDVE